jgi:membrane protein DedA with SNARE-associated domain
MNLLWQYLLIFLLVAVEGAGVTLAGAALAGVGALNPTLVFLAAGTGNLAGDLCWYLLGYFGQFEKVMRWFPSLAQLQPEIDRFKLRVTHDAPRMLLIAKLFFGIGSIPTLLAAGETRYSVWRIAPVQILGETIWTGSLVLIGLYFGQYVTQFAQSIQIIGSASALLFVLTIFWLVRRRLTSAKQMNLCITFPFPGGRPNY